MSKKGSLFSLQTPFSCTSFLLRWCIWIYSTRSWCCIGFYGCMVSSGLCKWPQQCSVF